MAERTYPGVYVEERKSGVAPIRGVSTSTMGIVGFTERGPSDVATLVESYTRFADLFDTFTSKSQLPTHVFAFFANGGLRAYIVRTTGAGSAKAVGTIDSDWSEEDIATGDGSVASMDSTAPSISESDLAHVPEIEPSSIVVSFKQTPGAAAAAGDTIDATGAPACTLLIPLGTPFYAAMVTNGASVTIAGATTPANDGTFPITAVSADGKTITYTNAGGVSEALAGTWSVSVVAEASDMSPTPASGPTEFAGKLGLSGVDTPIIPGTVIIHSITATEDYTDPNKDGVLEDVVNDPGVPKGFVDYDTGHFVISMDTAPVNPADVTYDYTNQGPDITVTDDGVGGWNLPATAGAVDYTTGEWSMTVPYPPADTLPVLAAYTQQVWNVEAVSEGEWGDDVHIDVRGDADYFTRSTASYSRWDALVYRVVDGTQLDLKIFDNLSLTDPTDTRYIATILNNEGIGSTVLSLEEPSNEDVAPWSLTGRQRSRGVGAGDGTQGEFGSSGATPTIPNPFVTGPLETPVQPGSVSIAYTDTAGVARTITDDGDGNLIGDVDPTAAAGFNEIDYDTGEFAFATGDGSGAVAVGDYDDAGTAAIPTISYYLEPAEATQAGQLSGGADGAALTRNELTDPTLLAGRTGMYALLKTNEIINLTIPDAAGNVTMSLDQTTEAERNGLWFVVLATPPGYTPQQAQDYRLNKLGYNGSYAALYYPYITITDPVTDLPTNIPPGGHICGVYARTDQVANVGTAPAGVDRGRLNFSVGLERTLEFGELSVLHPYEVNSIMDTTETGRAVWGARSLERPGADFTYLHVRRLFNFIKKSIFNSTHGFVFENVGADLRARITSAVEAFMRRLFNQGLFKGSTPSEAFKVVCDETNNPQEVEDAGEVICDIYVAPNTPGEFIVFRIQKILETA